MKTIRMRRRLVVISASVAGLIIVTIVAVIELEPFKHEATSFSVPNCEAGPATIEGGTLAEQLRAMKEDQRLRPRLTSKWVNNDFVLRTRVCVNCSAHLANVTTQVIGNLVLLRVYFEQPNLRAACDCEHPIDIRLSALPRRDYKIMRIGAPIDPEYCL
jgi:hypothetical protein